MKFWPKAKSDSTTRVIVDIGSGSIGMALLNDDKALEGPVLWSYREYTNSSENYSQPTQKLIQTTLLEVMLQLQNKGLPLLLENKLPPVSEFSVYISAPWVMTFSKSVVYKQEHAFTITENLLNDLYASVEEAVQNTINDKAPANADIKELTIIQNLPSCVIANGYQLTKWDNVKTKQLKVHYVLAATHKQLAETIAEVHNKMLTSSKLELTSYAQIATEALRSNHPSTNEAVIIHITADATELIIIRNGLLQTVNYAAFGYRSLYEKLATEMKIPKGEAETRLKEAEFPEKWQTSKTLSSYTDEIKALLTETGDALAIPKLVFIDVDNSYYDFFAVQLAKIAKQTTALQHTFNPLLTHNNADSTEQFNNMLLAIQHHKYTN